MLTSIVAGHRLTHKVRYLTDFYTVAAVTLADPEDKRHALYAQVEDKVAGICRYCARAFHVYEKAEELGVPFLAEYRQHPSIRARVAEGYQIITF